jgi:hypothetical protein
MVAQVSVIATRKQPCLQRASHRKDVMRDRTLTTNFAINLRCALAPFVVTAIPESELISQLWRLSVLRPSRKTVARAARGLDFLTLAGYFGFLDVGKTRWGDSRNSGYLLKERVRISSSHEGREGVSLTRVPGARVAANLVENRPCCSPNMTNIRVRGPLLCSD